MRDMEVVPLLTGPDIGEDAEEVASRELEALITDALPEEDHRARVSPEIVIADNPVQGIARFTEDTDILLLGTSASTMMRELKAARLELHGDDEPSGTTFMAVRPDREVRASIPARLLDRATGWLPKLQPAQRVDLFDRLQAGAKWNVDFTVAIGLSTAMAALGLMQNSTAVVIGAMVIAPLMTPLIGAGLALVQGNIRLFRESIRAMLWGIVTALSISIIVGLIVPLDEPTIELYSRAATRPCSTSASRCSRGWRPRTRWRGPAC